MTAQPWASLTPGTMYWSLIRDTEHGPWLNRVFAFGGAALQLRTAPLSGWDMEVRLWTARGVAELRVRHPCNVRRAAGFSIGDWNFLAQAPDEVCGLRYRAEGEEVRLSLSAGGGWLYLGRDGHGNGNLYFFDSPQGQDLRYGLRAYQGSGGQVWPGPCAEPPMIIPPNALRLGERHPDHPDL